METYLGQVEALVIEQDWLPPEELGVVWRLVEHGEPAEGLCQLAWVITNRRRGVPAEVITSVRRLTEGLVDPADPPPNLDDRVP